jgi:hypothetical protein
LMFGYHDAVETIGNENRNIWNEKGIPGALRFLIEAQEKATPKHVGGKVSILRIDKNGAEWIEPGLCSAIPRR